MTWRGVTSTTHAVTRPTYDRHIVCLVLQHAVASRLTHSTYQRRRQFNYCTHTFSLPARCCYYSVRKYIINKWSKQFDIRPHRRRWRTVESYSPDGASLPSHVGTLAPPAEYDWTGASFGPSESTTQTANRSVRLFLHSFRQKVSILYSGRPFPQNCPFLWGIWTSI